mmetsp:Transcript_656/g.2196  ORF Transcript_656/g.2196 Transcript_656/m.2196 type:complete len:205 (-) Transcript_656:716-1330(-)
MATVSKLLSQMVRSELVGRCVVPVVLVGSSVVLWTGLSAQVCLDECVCAVPGAAGVRRKKRPPLNGPCKAASFNGSEHNCALAARYGQVDGTSVPVCASLCIQQCGTRTTRSAAVPRSTRTLVRTGCCRAASETAGRRRCRFCWPRSSSCPVPPWMCLRPQQMPGAAECRPRFCRQCTAAPAGRRCTRPRASQVRAGQTGAKAQ